MILNNKNDHSTFLKVYDKVDLINRTIFRTFALQTDQDGQLPQAYFPHSHFCKEGSQKDESAFFSKFTLHQNSYFPQL